MHFRRRVRNPKDPTSIPRGKKGGSKYATYFIAAAKKYATYFFTDLKFKFFTVPPKSKGSPDKIKFYIAPSVLPTRLA